LLIYSSSFRLTLQVGYYRISILISQVHKARCIWHNMEVIHRWTRVWFKVEGALLSLHRKCVTAVRDWYYSLNTVR